MLSTTKFKLVLTFGALLIAGLFFFRQHSIQSDDLALEQNEESGAGIKPSMFLPGNPNAKMAEAIQREVSQVENSAVTVNAGSGNTETLEAEKDFSAQDQQKWTLFKQILASRNDNDSRMDSEFKSMSPELHRAMIEQYSKLPDEDRNGRGTIAFLIARDLNSEADATFLKKVFEETPCTGFDKCNSTMAVDPHHSGSDEVSLNYPQMATLFQIDAKLQAQPAILKDKKARDAIVAVIRQAEAFPVPMVHNKARQIAEKYGL